VMKEKDNFSANFLLQTSCGAHFSEQESLRKKSARLLAETDNWVIHHSESVSCSGGGLRIAEQSVLENWTQDENGSTANEVIPEVTDIGGSKQQKDQCLGEQSGKKYG